MFGGYIAESVPFELTGAQTEEILWQPQPGKRILLFGIQFTVSEATEVDMGFWGMAADTEGNGAADPQQIKFGDFAANSGVDSIFRFPMRGHADEPIVVTTAAGNIKGVLYGIEE